MKIKRVNRDEKQIEQINQAVEIFVGEIETREAKNFDKSRLTL